MGELQLLLFDMDGVLVDTTSLLNDCYTGLAEYLNAGHPTEEELKGAIRMSPTKAIHYLFRDQRYEVLDTFNQYWKESIKQASAFPGISELLDELVAYDVVIGTVTSKYNSTSSIKNFKYGKVNFTLQISDRCPMISFDSIFDLSGFCVKSIISLDNSLASIYNF